MTEPDMPGTRMASVEVNIYDRRRGAVSWWDEDTLLRLETDVSPEPIVIISGNRAGLTSLARHLLTLAQEDTPAGSHMDFDTYCGWLEDGSRALRIEVE